MEPPIDRNKYQRVSLKKKLLEQKQKDDGSDAYLPTAGTEDSS
jgi:hypothetical protein